MMERKGAVMAAGIRRSALCSVFAVCISTLAFAQEDEALHRFAGDLYRAGAEVRVDDANVEDLYAAGETITVDTIVRESVHAAGRQIRLNRLVGDDVYAAGYAVDIGGAVSGDVTVAGYRVELGTDGSIGQDALLAGRFVLVRGPIAGDANLAGETVEISAPISGSVEIRASEIRFTDGARIDGTLSYWSSNEVEVPAAVTPAGRVTAHLVEEMSPRGTVVGAFIGSLIFLLVIGAIFALLFPRVLMRAQTKFSERPWACLFLGFATTSALFGAILVFATSIIGIPLVPLLLLALPFALAAGYLTSAYLLGHRVLKLFRFESDAGRLSTLFAVLAGIIVLLIVGLVPILGWVIVVLATVLGIGALCALRFNLQKQTSGAA
jgi:cytoskeletal protein CcmA (bactofilin family)